MNASGAAAVVVTEGLTKRYGSLTALDQCQLHVFEGEVFGLLGPNGSGKSTLLRTLMGLVRPTAGTAAIDGLDCWRDSLQVRRLVSYLPGEARLFRQLRGRDVLELLATARDNCDRQQACALADRLQLDLSRRVAFMSTGMRQKLALCAVLAVRCRLLILDEPTSNLDPSVRQEVLQLVSEAQRRGQTVLFSSHVLSEVEEVCQRVLLLRRGRMVHIQDLTQLRHGHRIRAQLGGPLPAAPAELAEGLTIRNGDDRQVLIDSAGDLSRLLGWLAAAPIEEMRIEPLGLRTVYDEHFRGIAPLHDDAVDDAPPDGGGPDEKQPAAEEARP